MYRTFEAEIRNGRLIGGETASLPNRARVLITLLDVQSEKKRPPIGTRTSEEVKMCPDALSPLTDDALSEWGL
jgi:hypothetical protein